MVKLCVPITGETLKEIECQLGQLELLEFDMIEWRADYFFSVEALDLIRGAFPETELLFTIRSMAEGGASQSEERELISLYKRVAESGKVDLIDLELAGICKTNPEIIGLLKASGVQLVISNHDFEKTASKEELIDRYKKMADLGGDIGKIAMMPNTLEDVDTLIKAAKEAGELINIPIVAISMGEMGIQTRIKGAEFGSIITFGCLEKASAPGQMPIKELKKRIEEG